MPFCESCGSDIQPGKQFCTECGAPVARPAAPAPVPQAPPLPQQTVAAPPVPPASPPPSPSLPYQKQKLPAFMIVFAIILVAVVAGVVVLVALPMLQGHGTGGQASGGLPPTPVPSLSSVTVSPSATVRVIPPTVYRSGVAYSQVYAHQYSSGSAHAVFSYTLQEPPMLVECDMNPEMTTREKLVDIGTSSERYITATYPNPDAWLELKIINADTGDVVETIRFSKNYAGSLNQEYTIRAPGAYRFEMNGALVSPAVRLLVKQ